MKILAYSLLIFVLLLVCVGINVNMTIYHENAHKEIFKEYGIHSTIEYKWFSLRGASALTIPEKGYCNDNCKSDQNLNDIVGYHLFALQDTIFILASILILIIFVIGKEVIKNE